VSAPAASGRSVLIVEDVPEMRELLALVFEGVPGWRVSGRAATAAEARWWALRERPQVVLLDEILPGESAAELAHELATAGLDVWFVSATAAEGRGPLPAGVRGRLLKPAWDTLGADRTRFLEALEAPGMPHDPVDGAKRSC
jgi:response regulator of citrate/malate metabolism